MTRPILALLLACAPVAALAAGSAPATQTPTTVTCADGLVWDAETRACVAPQDARLEDGDRLDAARELATFGRVPDARTVLAAVAAPDTADALTVRGYVARMGGDFEAGRAYYDRALSIDPDHWQARAYLGEALLNVGDRAGAEAQLAAIRAGGGRGAWPERALAGLLQNGGTLYGAR